MVNFIAETYAIGKVNRSVSAYLHRRLDNILLPVPLAGGHITRQRKIRQRGQRDVVGPADSTFEHPTAPNRNVMGLADIVDPLRLGKPAHAAELDIDNAASPQLNGLLRMMGGANTFIETDGRLDLPL